jgi:hypothetical protein
MKISELFLKPIDRPIEGVIKADDERHEEVELEEYVVTHDVAMSVYLLGEALSQSYNYSANAPRKRGDKCRSEFAQCVSRPKSFVTAT